MDNQIELSVSSVPAVINVNFEEAKARLEEDLKRYDVLVTLETLPDAKKLATELNKKAGDFKALKKEIIDKVSAPIKLFDNQGKELIQLYLDGRQKLLDQIAKFEDETKEAAKNELLKRRAELWEKENVDPEFQHALIDDLIKLNTLTKTGNLSKSPAETLLSRVREDKSHQESVKTRLILLENQSYKAGLAAPLTRSHVETFLFDDEETYQSKLDGVLKAEIERQEATERGLRQRIEKENALAVEAAEKTKPEPIEGKAQEVVAAEPEKPITAKVEPEKTLKFAIVHGGQKPVFFSAESLQEAQVEAVRLFNSGTIQIWLPDGLASEITITHHEIAKAAAA